MHRVASSDEIQAGKLFSTEVDGTKLLLSRVDGEVKAVIDEALRCKEEGKEEVIFFNNSGHGHFDLGAYDAFLSGKLVDYEYPAELVEQALKNLPKID